MAEANAIRNWRIYPGFAQVVIVIAKPLCTTEPFGMGLAATVDAFDALLINL